MITIKFKYTMTKGFLFLASCLLLLTSCDKVVETDDGYVSKHDVPNSGAPVIKAVYAMNDVEQLVPLTEAAPGQRVCIIGENLNNLRRLTFNTVEADLGETFTALTKAVVKIPATYSKAHDNTIVYTTDMGTVSYRFAVALPIAEVDGLLNEFAAAGSEAVVAGKNLQYYDFTLTLNGQQLPLTVKDTQLSFTIPQGTPDNSTFIISWQTPQGEDKKVELPFRPTEELLFDDLSQTVQEQTDEHVGIETSDMGMLCLHFSGIIKEWSWVELSFAQPFKELCDASAVSQYNFVFEVQNAVGKPLLDKGYEFAWNWDWNNSCRWNPGEGFDTNGKWQTVRLPLEEMAPKGFATTAENLVLNIGLQPYKDYDADFRLANFRIEKK